MRKTCSKCRYTYEGEKEIAVGFANSKNFGKRVYRKLVCVPCEQEARDGRKRHNRFRQKAINTLKRHAVKFGYAKERIAEFSMKFGWHVDQMAHDIEHAYSNGCKYCHEKFATMGHGLADITLDVMEPSEDPYYQTNCAWVCSTCNCSKGKTPKTLWGTKLNVWRGRASFLAKTSEDDREKLHTLWEVVNAGNVFGV